MTLRKSKKLYNSWEFIRIYFFFFFFFSPWWYIWPQEEETLPYITPVIIASRTVCNAPHQIIPPENHVKIQAWSKAFLSFKALLYPVQVTMNVLRLASFQFNEQWRTHRGSTAIITSAPKSLAESWSTMYLWGCLGSVASCRISFRFSKGLLIYNKMGRYFQGSSANTSSQL